MNLGLVQAEMLKRAWRQTSGGTRGVFAPQILTEVRIAEALKAKGLLEDSAYTSVVMTHARGYQLTAFGIETAKQLIREEKVGA